MQPAVRSNITLKNYTLPVVAAILLVMQLIDGYHYRGWTILLAGLGGMFLLSTAWAILLTRHLRLSRKMRLGWAQVGDHLQERFEIENNAPLPVLWFEVRDHSNLPGYNASRASGMAGSDFKHWPTRGICTQRGTFTLGPTSLHTGDPFGIYTVELFFPGKLNILVTPPVIPLPTIQVAPGGRSGEGHRSHRSVLTHTISAAGVRDYVPGDSLRWVHWPTSARRDELYVRRFDNTPAGDWWIFLDLNHGPQLGSGAQSTLEHGIILAASLAWRGLEHGRAVGLAAYGVGPTWLPPQPGDGQRWRILRALAELQSGRQPFSAMLTHMGPRLGQHASIILITPAVDGEWLAALEQMQHRGAIPTVLLFDPASYQPESASDHADQLNRLVATLDRRSVTSHVIARDLFDHPDAQPGGQIEWRKTQSGKFIPIRQPAESDWKAVLQ